jgi:hypothetical protein
MGSDSIDLQITHNTLIIFNKLSIQQPYNLLSLLSIRSSHHTAPVCRAAPAKLPYELPKGLNEWGTLSILNKSIQQPESSSGYDDFPGKINLFTNHDSIFRS